MLLGDGLANRVQNNGALRHHAALCRLFGHKVVMNVNGLDWTRAKWGPVARVYFKSAAHSAVRFCTELVTDAEAMREFYLREVSKETTMIAYGAYVGGSVDKSLIEPFGVEPEGYYLIAVHYWDKVYRDPDLTADDKKEYIALGQTQLDKALEIDDQYVDALIYKNLLLREEAKIEPNARRKAELTAQADELRDRAMALREQQQAAEKAAAAASEAEGEAKEPPPPTQPPSSH